ncbi:hypothetical protein FHT78_005465 [Rhizobium sp. BK196]|uniref:hypothetical protein n=1 Tax=Rhizobium sp. BK196 TaxID=2587073 RepID=UPI00161F2F10|nr:hypothetical protein [Rhizobium sp. BK196]MBB3313671.1 hypothetical protein [Rhizobium sp. BK196]
MFSIASHETSSQPADDLYLWTDEGYDHLHGHSNAFEHVLPTILIDDRRTPDELLEAIAARGALLVAIAAVVVAGLIGLAGSVGLERTERATEIAARI